MMRNGRPSATLTSRNITKEVADQLLQAMKRQEQVGQQGIADISSALFESD